MSITQRLPKNKTNKQRRNITVNFPAPIGGLNARDALDTMPPTDCVQIENINPLEGYMQWRNGYTVAEASGITSGATIQTLFEYSDSSVQWHIAADDATIYRLDVAGVNTLASGFSEGRWDWVNFGGYGIMVNGADAPQYIKSGTAATIPVIIGTSGFTIKRGATVSAGSVATASTFIGVHAHRSHLYFWQDDSQSVYYGGVNEIFPEIEEFPMDRVATLGGKLLAVGSWSVSGAANAAAGGSFQDVIVFAFDTGELLVYEGDDPGSNFALLGVYRTGRPLGRDCMVEVADDLLIATEDGLTPLTQVLQAGRASRSSLVSDKIRGAWIDDASEYFDNVGWQVLYYPKKNFVIVNIPVRPIETADTGSARYDQWMYNLNVGAWTRWTNHPSAVWGIYAGNLYFGGADSGNVLQADTTQTDNGSPIDGFFRQAYQRAETRAHVNAIQPAVWTDGSPTIQIGCETAFQSSTKYLVTYQPTPPGATWDQIDIDWDLWETPWGSDDAAIVQNWKAIVGRGDSINVRFFCRASDALRVYGTDVELEQASGF